MSFTQPFIDFLRSGKARVVAVEVDCNSGGVETTRYLSDVGYVSTPTDTPANTVFHARITGGFRFSQSINPLTGEASVSFGSLEIDNTDGALDAWINDVFAKRGVRILIGSQGAAFASFVQVFSGAIAALEGSGRQKFNLVLSDTLAQADVSISTAVVGGTTDAKDTSLPIMLGEVFNAEPTLIDETTGTYQVCEGAVKQVIEVRDNGYPVSFTPDAANGKFTLTYQRYGRITCDVQGLKLEEYRTDAGGLVEYLLTRVGDTTKLDSGVMDSSLTAWRTAHPQPVGVVMNGKSNRLATAKAIAASLGAALMITRTGTVKLVQVAFGTPTRTIRQSDILKDSFGLESTPGVYGAFDLSGGKNWTVQQSDEIASALVDGQKQILGKEWIACVAKDVSVLALYKQALPDETTETLLVVEADIQAEAQRRLDIWKTPRHVYSFECFAEFLDLEIGQTVTVVYPRFGLNAGKPGVVVGLDSDFISGRVSVKVLI